MFTPLNEIRMVPKIEAKSWNPTLEMEILKKWESDDTYNFSVESDKSPFVIDTPPPYPSGRPWHIGAAASLRADRHDCTICKNVRTECLVSNRHR